MAVFYQCNVALSIPLQGHIEAREACRTRYHVNGATSTHYGDSPELSPVKVMTCVHNSVDSVHNL
jgi:hypothetical protein